MTLPEIVLEFLLIHGESEYKEILNGILNYTIDFSASNIRSILNSAITTLVKKGDIMLTAYHYTNNEHKCYYAPTINRGLTKMKNETEIFNGIKSFMESEEVITKLDTFTYKEHTITLRIGKEKDNLRFIYTDEENKIILSEVVRLEEYTAYYAYDCYVSIDWYATEQLSSYFKLKQVMRSGFEPRFNHNSEVIGYYPIGSPYTTDMQITTVAENAFF